MYGSFTAGMLYNFLSIYICLTQYQSNKGIRQKLPRYLQELSLFSLHIMDNENVQQPYAP
jgi:hypothetical protein